MATLAVDSVRNYEYSGEDLFNDLPIIASDIVYEGAAIGENGSGYYRPLVAGDPFGGFAVRKVDNSTGAAGDLQIRTRSKGLVQLNVTGWNTVAQQDGVPVYAADDNDFTTTAGSNTLIGRTHRFISSGVGIVYFEATSLQV